MKKLLIILFLLVSLMVQATTYYIATTGSNSNNGSSGSPWLTLTYACAHTTSGDIIHVNAGTYTETSQCTLAVGVSIEGVGVTSHIISHLGVTRSGGNFSGASIWLYSSSQGTDGSQHISNIWLDGDYLNGNISGTTYQGIVVWRRKNVSVYNCTISGFYSGGISFIGGDDAVNNPTTAALNNQVYNCIFTDCAAISDLDWGGCGMIEIRGQANPIIHDNTFTQNGYSCAFTDGCWGDVIQGSSGSYGLKYYNNKSYKPEDSGDYYSLHMEIWNTLGGFEIYNNEFHGGGNAIDIAGFYNLKGSSAYSWYIHDNLFTCNPTTGLQEIAIQMEDADNEDVWIYRNRFTNWPLAINTTNGGDKPTQILRRIYITYNIFDYGTWTCEDQYKNIFRLRAASGTGNFDGFYIYNNVIKGPTDAYTTAIKLEIESGAVFNNLYIKNNIILNNANGTWLNVVNSGSVNGLYVDYNILYNNAGSNDPTFSGNSVSNYTFSNDSKTSPPFVSSSDYHLTAARNGVAVTFPMTWLDYGGSTISSPPEIGVYEYGASSPTVPTVTTTSVTNIATTTASSGGNVISDGGASVTVRGVCWSTTTNPTTSLSTKTSNGTGTGSFSSSITGLTPNTLYYVRAYATNSAGTGYGNRVQFTTSASISLPTITTTPPWNQSKLTAYWGGTIVNNGGDANIIAGICFGTSHNPDITAAPGYVIETYFPGNQINPFTVSFSGDYKTTYYYRAYGTNSAGTSYGAESSFTTSDYPYNIYYKSNGSFVKSNGKFNITY